MTKEDQVVKSTESTIQTLRYTGIVIKQTIDDIIKFKDDYKKGIIQLDF